MIKKALRILSNRGIGVLLKKGIRKITKRDLMYEKYIKENEESEEGQGDTDIRFSILVPLYNTPVKYLEALVDSVLSQTYENFELCFSDGSGEENAKELKRYLAELITKEDNAGRDRIKLCTSKEPLDISSNTNRAFSVSTGDLIVFMDHDDLLSPTALFEIYKAKKNNPGGELFYSDEDKVDAKGRMFFEPHFKPDFDPALLCSTNYICHLTAVTRDLYERVGGVDPEFNGAQDYDFVLRCTEKILPKNIIHIKKFLYHWRFHKGSTAKNVKSKTYAYDAGRRALEAHYKRVYPNLLITVENTVVPGIYKTVTEDYGRLFECKEIKHIKTDKRGIIIDAGSYFCDSGYEPPYDAKEFKGFDITEYGYMNRLLCMRYDQKGDLYIP